MQQIAILVFLVGSLLQLSEAQEYGDGICSGRICAQITSTGTIECINDPEAITDAGNRIFMEAYFEAGTDVAITAWSDVAINPLDGTIYVIYQKSSADDYLGTIEDPLTDTDPFQVTPIGQLSTQQYSGMTFDCEGNLYGVSWAGTPSVYQFDYNPGATTIDTLLDDLTTCQRGAAVDCIESLFYNFEDEIFYRISSAVSQQDVFYTRDTILADDMPSGPPAGTNMPAGGTNGICAAGSLKYTAAFYIGQDLSIISCEYDEQLYLLSGTPNSPDVTIISNTANKMSAGANGLWNYNDNGDICKPPSCTDAPTFNPTKTPTDNPSKSPSKAPTTKQFSEIRSFVLAGDYNAFIQYLNDLTPPIQPPEAITNIIQGIINTNVPENIADQTTIYIISILAGSIDTIYEIRSSNEQALIATGAGIDESVGSTISFMDLHFEVLSSGTIITNGPTIITNEPTIITNGPTIITNGPTTNAGTNPSIIIHAPSDDSDDSDDSNESNESGEAAYLNQYNLDDIDDNNINKILVVNMDEFSWINIWILCVFVCLIGVASFYYYSKMCN